MSITNSHIELQSEYTWIPSSSSARPNRCHSSPALDKVLNQNPMQISHLLFSTLANFYNSGEIKQIEPILITQWERNGVFRANDLLLGRRLNVLFPFSFSNLVFHWATTFGSKSEKKTITNPNSIQTKPSWKRRSWNRTGATWANKAHWYLQNLKLNMLRADCTFSNISNSIPNSIWQERGANTSSIQAMQYFQEDSS